jgi:hypothetical protein
MKSGITMILIIFAVLGIPALFAVAASRWGVDSRELRIDGPAVLGLR